MLSLHTNAAALSSQNAVGNTQKSLTTSLTRLGTGFRVNSAMDDAAGLQIATRLDAQTREIMQLELLRLWERRKLTTLFVTHSVEEAILLADRVVVMGPAPQSLREIVAIDLPRPRTDEVRTSSQFIVLRTYLTGKIREMITQDPHSPFFNRA